MKHILVSLALLSGGLATPARAADDSAQLHAESIGQAAFQAFQSGLIFDDWAAFEKMLSDDIVFWFPSMSPERRHLQGKSAMMGFFRGMTKDRSGNGLGIRFMDPLRYTASPDHVALETRVYSENAKGEVTYLNRVFISLDVCGAKICAYREYFGGDRKSN